MKNSQGLHEMQYAGHYFDEQWQHFMNRISILLLLSFSHSNGLGETHHGVSLFSTSAQL